jgi:hypothetical protein
MNFGCAVNIGQEKELGILFGISKAYFQQKKRQQWLAETGIISLLLLLLTGKCRTKLNRFRGASIHWHENR